jgi:transcriptional regulator with XRE-family HTH domain
MTPLQLVELLCYQPMKTNADNLKGLMAKHGMTRKATAELIEIAPQTLNGYLAPEGAPSYRPMPNNLLRLLKLELGEARPKLPTLDRAKR